MISFDDILSGFRPITLGEMDSVKLMNRVDTKYVMDEGVLARFLRLCVGDYRVLVADGSRVAGYESLYYDTPDRQMYLRHLYGRKTRQKVRTRTYLSSGLTFLEVKRKNNHGRTKKKRLMIRREEFADFSRNKDAVDFLARKSWYEASQLVPVLDVCFKRITLVNDAMTERMTIDRGLRFGDVGLEGLVIVEIKQDGLVQSVARRRLHGLHVQEFRVSKYCVGTMLTCPELPNNRLKPKLRYIEKIIQHII